MKTLIAGLILLILSSCSREAKYKGTNDSDKRFKITSSKMIGAMYADELVSLKMKVLGIVWNIVFILIFTFFFSDRLYQLL